MKLLMWSKVLTWSPECREVTPAGVIVPGGNGGHSHAKAGRRCSGGGDATLGTPLAG